MSDDWQTVKTPKSKKKNKNRESGYGASPSSSSDEEKSKSPASVNPFGLLSAISEDGEPEPVNTSASAVNTGASASAGQGAGSSAVPGANSGNNPGNMATADPPTVQLNSRVSLPDYSGLKIGSKYVGRDGKESSEIFDADDWIFLVETTFESAGYEEDKWVKTARVKLVPQTPAFMWSRIAGEFKKWEHFREAFLDQFATKESAIEKVNLLKSFKQRGKEPVSQYLNRLTLNHTKFLKDMPKEFTGWSTVDAVVLERNKVISRVTGYYARAFFIAGLRDEILAQVTIEGTENFDEVVLAAQRTEMALQLKEKAAAISTVNSKDFKQAVQEEVQRQLRESSGTSGTVSATQAQGQGQSRAGKDKGEKKFRDPATVTCFYCGQKAHYATACAQRQDDRDKGIYRPTVQCPKMTREQFNNLSSEEKNRGVRIFGKRGQQSGQAARSDNNGAPAGAASSSLGGAVQRVGPPHSAWGPPPAPYGSRQAREDAFSHFRSSN